MFDLVRIQGMSQREAAEVLGVSAKTVQRRWFGVLTTVGRRGSATFGPPQALIRHGITRSAMSDDIPRPAAARRDVGIRPHARRRLRRRARNCCRQVLEGAGAQCQAHRSRDRRPVPPSRGDRRRRRRSVSADESLPQIPGYEVEAVLGRGGMGVVYKARHLQLNRPSRSRCCSPAPTPSRTSWRGSAARPRRWPSLRHPNIVQVYDVGEFDGRPYFTMEFVDGGSLAQQAGGHAAAGRARRPRWSATLAARRARRPPRRHRPPRPQARQRPAHRRRHAEGHRLRPGPPARATTAAMTADRRAHRHAELHGPRAGRGHSGRDRPGRPTCTRWARSSTSC